MADSNLPVPITDVHNLAYVERDGQILFSCKEIGRHLGYADPAKAILNIYTRNVQELHPFSTTLKLRVVDGKQREVRHFTEEGVYIISMLANTPAAQNFRAMLAGLLRQIRERRIELAREAGYQQGREEALSLPVMEAERKRGYLEGLCEGMRIARREDRFNALVKIAAYREKGLNYAEIGKILDLSANAVAQRVKRAKKLGFWPQATPRQQFLPGVK